MKTELRKVDRKRASRFLALVLRHQPGALGLELDEHGWVNVEFLLQQLRRKKRWDFSLGDLEELVRLDAKGRYSLRDGRIRANQGHSISVRAVDLTPQEPPEVLFHGTTQERWRKIQAGGGISKMRRHHVHLSATTQAAWEVGRRHRRERAALLKVNAQAMHQAGKKFFLSENGVWLTDHVDLEFVELQALAE